MEQNRKGYKKHAIYSKIFSKKNIKWFTFALLFYCFTILFLLPIMNQLQKPDSQLESRLKEKIEVLKKNPTDPQLLTDVAWAYFEQGRLEDASQTIERALNEDENYAGANYLNGLIQTDLLNYRSAEKSFKKVIASSNGNKEAMLLAFYGLGLLHKQKEDFINAIKYLQLAIEQKPENANLHYELGTIYWQMGNDRLAETAFYKATSLEPELISAIDEIKKGS